MLTREQIETWLKENEPSVRSLVNGADDGHQEEKDFLEFGRLLVEPLKLGSSFAQRIYYGDNGDGTGWHIRLLRYGFQPTLGEIWLVEPAIGVIHTHPSSIGGMDLLSSGDLDTFARDDFKIMMMATRAGTGKLHVIARWKSLDGEVENTFVLEE